MNKKKLISALSITACVALLSAIGFAATTSKEVKAILNLNYSVKNGGKVQVLKNSSGKTVYPITYNGQVYLPADSIGKILDVPVRFDSTSKTVFLGSEVQQPKSVLKFKAKTSTYCSKVTDKGSLTIQDEDGADIVYKDGIYFDVWNSAASVSIDRSYQANVGGIYNELSFDFYAIPKGKDDSKQFIGIVYDVDTKETIAQITVNSGEVKKVEGIDITGVKTIGFASNCASYGTNGHAYFFNPTVK